MKYLIIAALMVSAPSFATGFDIGSSRQEQGQTQRQDQSQKAYGGDAKSLAVARSISALNVNQESNAGTYNIRTVPNAIAPNVYPTAPCMGSSSVGGSGMAFGFSIGTSWVDDECGIRETARSFAGMGLNSDALKVLCSSKYAAVAPACMAK